MVVALVPAGVCVVHSLEAQGHDLPSCVLAHGRQLHHLAFAASPRGVREALAVALVVGLEVGVRHRNVICRWRCHWRAAGGHSDDKCVVCEGDARGGHSDDRRVMGEGDARRGHRDDRRVIGEGDIRSPSLAAGDVALHRRRWCASQG